jgi:hypothetical protein
MWRADDIPERVRSAEHEREGRQRASAMLSTEPADPGDAGQGVAMNAPEPVADVLWPSSTRVLP